MRYSIIVPVFDSERFLDACVASVLAQSVSDWELLLIDDGSRDGSGAIADGYAARDPRIRVFHQENRGQFFARETGIAASAGDYLLFLDSDDRFEPESLAVLNREIANGAPDMILFAARIFENGADTGRVIGRVSAEAQTIPRRQLRERLLSSHDLNSLCLKAFRRGLFAGDSTDYARVRRERFGEDKIRLLYPVTRAETIRCVPETLYQYHHRPDSVMRGVLLSDAERMLANDMFAMLREYLAVWNMDTPEYRAQLDAYYLRHVLSVYYGLRKNARTAAARKALRAYPRREKLYLPAFRFRAVKLLSARDRLRLLAAALRL